jgi:hypothetical protein
MPTPQSKTQSQREKMKIVTMEKTYALLMVTLLVAFLVGSEAGRELKPKEEVYNPKTLGFFPFGGWGLGHGFGPFWGGGPFGGFGHGFGGGFFPGFGGGCGLGGFHGLKDAPKGYGGRGGSPYDHNKGNDNGEKGDTPYNHNKGDGNGDKGDSPDDGGDGQNGDGGQYP